MASERLVTSLDDLVVQRDRGEEERSDDRRQVEAPDDPPDDLLSEPYPERLARTHDVTRS